jgi:hypothetical protein
MAELTVICLSLAFTVAILCATVLMLRNQQHVGQVFRTTFAESITTLVEQRRHDTQHSPENHLIQAMQATMARQSELVETLTDKLLAFTNEGRDYRQMELTNQSLQTELALARENSQKLAEQVARTAITADPRVEDNGSIRSVGWGGMDKDI